MNAPSRPIRPVAQQPRIRVFHAYALMVRLERLAPHAKCRMWQRIARSAVCAVAALKRGLEISYHPFESAGWTLVLSSHWLQRHATLVIEVDLRPERTPSVTLVGPPRRRFARRRGRSLRKRNGRHAVER